ncbi:protein of unknown function [Bartonella clarridgeiae 73]|uniref:Uncharacterized protein n=1 Tax=Bartonella clarridgeiae (strain CCUG 45776 / CIP 104772 / 73) TaxID=696125 RepID=E6YJ44_BARC7|nr:protein of unknown function [Bartonella clarridgeiae 73]
MAKDVWNLWLECDEVRRLVSGRVEEILLP